MSALARQLAHRVAVGVEDDALMAAAHQPADDVAAHPSETDHSKLHAISSPWKTISGEARLDRRFQRGEPGLDIAAEMDAQGAPTALGEDIEVAARLRRLDGAEAVSAAWDAKVAAIIVGDLQKNAGIRSAFVGLAGRVEKAWPKADTSRDAPGVADHAPHRLQGAGMRRIALDIGEQRAVVALPELTEMRPQITRQRGARAAIGECPGIPLVGEERDPVGGEDRLFRPQPAALLVLVGELAGLDLAGLDIGLVERTEANDGAGDGGGDLPAEEFLAELAGIREGDADDRLAGALQRVDGAVLRGIGAGIETQIGEETVAAVDFRRTERLAIDRDHPLAVLAGRFGDELFEPGAELADAGRGDDRQLVAARLGRHSHDGAEHDSGIIRGRYAA